MQEGFMESGQLALKLLLDELDVEPVIRTVSQRKAVQKSVYLAQLSGVDFGYHYNWYVMGPYSPGLTRDYYALEKALAEGDQSYDSRELRGAVRRKLDAIKPLLTVPDGVQLNQANWLELVASLHYLLKQRSKSLESARAIIEDQKTHVADYVDSAYDALAALKLV